MGAIELKKGIDGFQAAPGTVLFGVDLNGNPVVKDENGVVSSSATLDGSPVSLNNQVSDPAAELTKIKVYTKDVSGVSEMFVRDSDGNVIQMTDAGAPAGGSGGGGLTVAWNGPVGTQFVDTDVIAGAVGNLYMCHVEDGESVGLTLPTSVGNAGQLIGLVNQAVTGDSFPTGGEIGFLPQPGEVAHTSSPGTPLLMGPGITSAVFIADGNGRWDVLYMALTLGGEFIPV